LNTTGQLAHAQAAIRRVQAKGRLEVEQFAASTIEDWAARMRRIKDRARADFWKLRDEQLAATTQAARAEIQREAVPIYKMLEAVQAAEGSNFTGVLTQARAWGRSQEQNKIFHLAEYPVRRSKEVELATEEDRLDSVVGLKDALFMAQVLVGVAQEAEKYSADMTNAKGPHLIGEIVKDNKAAIVQAKQAQLLSDLSKQVVRKASALARSALSRAKAAEAAAEQALQTAQKNTRRIAALKFRVQKAEQRTQGALNR